MRLQANQNDNSVHCHLRLNRLFDGYLISPGFLCGGDVMGDSKINLNA